MYINEITKGDWKINRHAETCVEVGNRSICSTGGYQSNADSEKVWAENVANAKLISFAGNLAQKYNIEAFEELCQALAHAVDLLPAGNARNMAAKALKKATQL